MRTFIFFLTIIIFSSCAIEAQTKKKPPKNKNDQSTPDVSYNKKPVVAKMISVRGGIFLMGSDDSKSTNGPTHQVTVGGFKIGNCEVTQELWESIMGNNPSYFKGRRRPVEHVSWYDVVEFCNKLSEKEGLQKTYSGSGDKIICDFNLNGYRLPTEAEWEYAAKGGNLSRGYKYSGSNVIEEVGWYYANSGSETKEVGTKRPNELGLYDMSGNLWEWCWDSYGDYSSSSQSDPRNSVGDSTRIFRGGTWSYFEEYCLVTYRYNYNPNYRGDNLGFRLVRTK